MELSCPKKTQRTFSKISGPKKTYEKLDDSTTNRL